MIGRAVPFLLVSFTLAYIVTTAAARTVRREAMRREVRPRLLELERV
jgi:hypothetical protein